MNIYRSDDGYILMRRVSELSEKNMLSDTYLTNNNGSYYSHKTLTRADKNGEQEKK